MAMPNNQDLNLRQVIDVLRRSRYALMLFVGSAMLSALALTYIYSERYRAVTTIMYRPSPSVRFEGVSQQTALGFPVPMLPFEVIGQTVQQVGTSERIIRSVVEDLGLDQADTTVRTGLAGYYHDTKEWVKKRGREAWQILKHGRVIDENPTSAAIVELAANTTIDTSRKNYAATLTVVDKNPVRAARIVDRLGEELVRFMEEQSVEAARRQGQELDERLLQKKSEIDGLRQRIAGLKVTHQFSKLDEETSLHLRTAEQLEQEWLANQAQLHAARAKLESVARQRQALEEMSKTSETIGDDPVYQKLREMKATSEVELEGQRQLSAATDPELRSIEAQLRTASSLLSSTEKTRVLQTTMALNEVHRTLHSEELKATAEVAGLQAAAASMRESVGAARARIPSPEIERQFNDLQLELSVLESNYQKLSTLREEVRAAELTSKAEVYVLHAATPQDTPFRPVKVYHVLLSGILALILGVGVVYLIDFLRSLMSGSVSTGGLGYA